MAPASVLTFPASPAYLRRFAVIVLSSIVLLLLAGTAFASIGTSRPIMSTQQLGMSGVEPGNLPDVTLLVGAAGTEDIASTIGDDLVPALSSLEGVHSVATEAVSSGRQAVYISIDDSADGALLTTISSTVADVMPGTPALVGGRAVADRDLLDRLNRSLLVAISPVMILLAVMVTVSVGGRYGLAVSASVALSTLVSGLLGAQTVGRFDGSLATTGVPAVLAGVLVSSVLAFRLLEWFKHPQGDDPAASIRRAVRMLLPELGLLIGGLVGAAVLLEVIGASRTPAVGVATGSIVAAIVTFAVLPSMLATLPQVPDEDDSRLFQLHLPDGRDVPTAILAGFGIFLLCLGAFATRMPSGNLLDESALPSGVTSRTVAETLRATGGDPTSALLVTIGAKESAGDAAAGETGSSTTSVRPEQVSAWSRAVSAMPSVGWVESASGRYVDGELAIAARADRFVQEGEFLAVVTPSVAARSLAARELGEMVRNVDIGGLGIGGLDIELSGVPADAAISAESGSGLLILLVVALAFGGAIAAFVIVRSHKTAAIVAVMRLIGVGGALGVYSVVVGDATMSELQLIALVVSLGVGLFELGVLRRLALQTTSIDDIMAVNPEALASAEESGFDNTDIENERMTDAIRTQGRAAVVGMSIVAVCGMGLLASDLEVARRLGIGLAAVMIVELLIGTWLLRPALLGERFFYVSFLDADASSRPAPVAARLASLGAGSTVGAHDLVLSTDGGSNAQAMDAHLMSGPTLNAHTTNAVGGSEMLENRRSTDPTYGSLAARSPESIASRALIDPQWRRVVQGLLRAEFSFQNDPANAELSTVFVEDTPVFNELVEHNVALRSNGFRVVGKGPRLVKAQAVDSSSPVTVAITVDHPERRLVDRDGRLLGVRRPERRQGMLWLAQDPSGRYRIAEAVDLGTAADPVSGEVLVVPPAIALTV